MPCFVCSVLKQGHDMKPRMFLNEQPSFFPHSPRAGITGACRHAWLLLWFWMSWWPRHWPSFSLLCLDWEFVKNVCRTEGLFSFLGRLASITKSTWCYFHVYSRALRRRKHKVGPERMITLALRSALCELSRGWTDLWAWGGVFLIHAGTRLLRLIILPCQPCWVRISGGFKLFVPRHMKS